LLPFGLVSYRRYAQEDAANAAAASGPSKVSSEPDASRLSMPQQSDEDRPPRLN
jgi:hypothetical protein